MLAPYPLNLRQTSRKRLQPLDTAVHSQSSPTSPVSVSALASSVSGSVSESGTTLPFDDHPPSPPPSHSRSQAASPTNGHARRKRKLFALRRPSSSSAAVQPNYTSDLRRTLQGDAGDAHIRGSTSAPSRPVGSQSGLGAAEGAAVQGSVPMQRGRSSSTASQTQTALLAPILTASEFVLLRKKSRGSKARRRTEPAPGSSTGALSPPHDLEPLPHESLSRHSQDHSQNQAQTRDMDRNIDPRRLSHDSNFRLVNGARLHTFRAANVPYPCSYDQRVVDNDIWESKWAQQTCGDVSFHSFETPPQKVLDIGCGSGSWILDCATKWKETQFVGLDVVALHADLQLVGCTEIAKRVNWVQGNFLEGLPFPNEEFDFVHVKRIARGVPEDKWDPLLEEIVRVMKPGGAFQLLEEELTFPGKPVDSDADLPASAGAAVAIADLPTVAATSPWSSASVLSLPGAPSSPPLGSTPASASASSSASRSSLQIPPPPPRKRTHGYSFAAAGGMVPMSVGLASVPTRPASKSAPQPYHASHLDVRDAHAHAQAEADEERERERERERHTPEAPRDPRDHALLEYIYAETHAARFINLEPLALLANSLSLYFSDVRTHPPLVLTFPPGPTSAQAAAHATADPGAQRALDAPEAMRLSEADSAHGGDAEAEAGRAVDAQARLDVSQDRGRKHAHAPEDRHKGKSDSVVVASTNVHPVHRHLHDADLRMSVVSPTPALTRMRSRSFSHRAAEETEAKTLRKRRMSAASSLTLANSASGAEVGGDGESATVTLAPSPTSSSHTLSRAHGIGHARVSALSGMSTMKARRPPRDREQERERGIDGKTIQLASDARTLNMHLALRTREVLACAESMWAFVCARQRANELEHPPANAPSQGHGNGNGRPRANSKTTTMTTTKPKTRPKTKTEEQMLALTRQDFDELLDWFELDMQDNARLGDAVREQLGWSLPRAKIPPNERRKEFMKACKQWELLQNLIVKKDKENGENKEKGKEAEKQDAKRTPGQEDAPLQAQSAGQSTRPSFDESAGVVVRNEDESSKQHRQLKTTPKSPKQEEPSPKPPPPERVSRTIRVFVAWKA